MSAGCMRLVLSYTVRAVCRGSPGYRTPVSRFTICSKRCELVASSWRWSPLCTAVGETEQKPPPKKKNSQANAKISSVGRQIPWQQIQLINDTGEDLGIMHSSDAIRITDKTALKLVLLDDSKDPPVYRLMSGKQIHEEQLKRREKQKAKTATVQVKELSFSSGIMRHDLTNKLKQVESWLEKNNHVRITLRSGRGETAESLDTALEEMVQQIGVTVGFVSMPKVIQDGRAAMCILRLPKAKELSKQNAAKKKAAASRSDDSGAEASQNKTASDANAAEESTQQ